MLDTEIERRFEEGSKQFRELRGMLDNVLAALEPLPQMKEDIATAKQDAEKVKDLVEAWSAVKAGGKFVKWVAPVVGGIIGGWTALKAGIWGLLR